MEHAIDLYTNMINIVLVSSLVIVLLTITITIIIGVKRKKNMKELCNSCGKCIDKDSIFCKYCGIRQKPTL